MISKEQIGFVRPAALVLVAFVLLFSWLVQFLRHAWFCSTCHQVTSGLNQSEFSVLGICEGCISRRVKGTLWDPKANFFAARLQERAWRRKRSIYRGLAYCVPGWGHVLFGRPVQGLVFVISFGAVLLPSLLWLPGDTPAAGALGGADMSFLLSVACVTVLFFTNAISAYRLGRGRG